MQSALIVHSKHTKAYAKLISKKYKDVKFLEVERPPTKKILKIKNDKDIVIGIGGGSTIDTAKIISGNKRCIAIPTTAAGACMTPYATVWGHEKISIPTKKPIVRMDYNISIVLPFKVLQSTIFDALSHAIESFWSKNATPESRKYSKKSIHLIKKYIGKNKSLLKREDTYRIIIAGNLAGKAIAITKTNIVHAVSYPITIEYGVDHGTACGMMLPYLIEYMNFPTLPRLFNLKTNKELASMLKKSFIKPKIKKFDAGLIATKAMKYKKINDGPRKMYKKYLIRTLENIE